MNKAKASLLSLAGLLLIPACSSDSTGANQSAADTYDLEGASIGGPFSLTDQDGKTVQWSDFAGRYRLVYFGYTYCPDVCPLDLSKIVAGYRKLEADAPAKAAKVQPIFITVDPARDTPEIMKSYVSAFHPKLIGLTGTPEQIEAVKKEFVVVSSKEGDPDATKDYLVSHSRTPILFDPDGKPIALVPFDDTRTPEDEAAPQIIEAFLDKWVK